MNRSVAIYESVTSCGQVRIVAKIETGIPHAIELVIEFAELDALGAVRWMPAQGTKKEDAIHVALIRFANNLGLLSNRDKSYRSVVIYESHQTRIIAKIETGITPHVIDLVVEFAELDALGAVRWMPAQGTKKEAAIHAALIRFANNLGLLSNKDKP